MTFLVDLWLPILLSAVFVFVVSSVLHMLIPIHKGDHRALPNEAAVLDALRRHGVQPGAYMFPCPSSMKDMGSPEMLAKYEQGPVGWINVMPNGAPAIGRNLLQWFVLSLAISAVCAYVAAFALQPGAEYLRVFRLTGTLAVMAYATGTFSESIWKGQAWSTAAKFAFDGLVYGLVTAGTFAWLWPSA
jgi:hypothetical protein